MLNTTSRDGLKIEKNQIRFVKDFKPGAVSKVSKGKGGLISESFSHLLKNVQKTILHSIYLCSE